MKSQMALILRPLRLCLLSLLLLGSAAFAAQPTAFDNWAKTAKIGGAAIAVGMSTAEINQILDDLVAQHVTVVEADSDLSNYQSDAQFELELALMRQVANESHKRGLRVVWYIPALEVITINGKNIPNTMAKDHPDWVQVGLDGQDNVFYGGGGQVFWVEADAESAWMSPSSTGYRNYFFSRIKKMVATGIDGIWADVPIYADFGDTKWSGFNPEAIARFESETGMSKPVAEDWDDPSWKRWIHWRHEELARFLKDMTTTARNIDSEFAIFAETLPTDYNGGTIYGLDASFIKDVEGLTEVWEIDTMSNNVGMRNARTDDWISFISALKYARGATGEKPSWTFSYGKQADDAQQVMAQALIAGNNPYELQVPEMATTVSAAFRARMFNWSKVNAPYLFESESTATTGILYSSASRDYVDQVKGLGMFATTDGGSDDLWWAEDPIDSVYQRDYLAEHRGVLKVLVNEHIPFNILVVPDQAELNRYQTVMLPNVEAISDVDANRLRQFVQQGGRLIVTGPNPTGMNQYGIARSNYALSDLLGFNLGDTLPTSKIHNFGSGQTYYFKDRLGKQYLASNVTSARTTLANAVRSASTVNISTNADDRVYVETSQLGQQAILQFTNFIGLNGTFSISPTTISVTYTVPNGETVETVALANPDTTSTAQTNLSFNQTGNQVIFNVPLTQYALVLVSFNGAQAPDTNHTPAAGDDRYQTDINASLDLSTANLLLNDGDLDGDTLSIGGVFTSGSSTGAVSNLGGGNYRYTPANGFTGTDILTYTLFDNNGAQDTGTITVTVAPSSGFYYPTAVNLTIGGVDSTDVNLLKRVDNETYDSNSVASGGKQVLDWYATTTISEDLASIDMIKVQHVGHYSLMNVSQRAYLYNYQSNAWDLFDATAVGNESNYPAVTSITNNIANYVSASKQMRVRIRAERSSGSVQSWSDQLVWEVVPVIPSSNTAPTASSQSVSVTENSNVAITLTANDPEGQALTYRVVADPNNGRLSGSLPTIQYQPNTGFVGSDSFTFVANDGALDSAVATVTISVQSTPTNTGGTVSNEISAGTLTIDGNIADWSGIPSLGRETSSISNSNAQVDFIEGWVAHDSTNLYIAYLNNGDINTQTWWPWQVYLDTDASSGSGYLVKQGLGAEYMLQGSSLYQYTGSGSNWSWDYLGNVTHAINGPLAEFQIPRATLGSPSSVRALFMGRNGTFTGDYSREGEDFYPKSYDVIPMHYGLLHGQYEIYGEIENTAFMKVTASAAIGATTLQLDANYPLLDNQLVMYLSLDGEYYTVPISTINGQTLTLAKPLPAPIGAGQDVWDFYTDSSHPHWFGYRAVADFSLRNLSGASLDQGRHTLLGDSWMASIGIGQRLAERLPNATFINKAVGGSSSADMLAQFDADVATTNPDVVWVLAGVNDYFGSVSASQYRSNILAIVNKINALGARAIIIDPPVAQLMFGSDDVTQLSHQYADALVNKGYVDYSFGDTTSLIVTDPVSNAQTISVDGDLSDWASLQSFGVDGADISASNAQADILEAWMAHDADKLYVAYTNDGNINTATSWPWQVFFDTDSNGLTGYQAGNNIGASFMLQGAGLYQYIGSGTDWSWQYVSGASGVVNGAIGEYQIPRSALGNPSKLRAVLITRNGIFTGDYSEAGMDRFPNADLGYLSYELGGSSIISNSVALNGLAIDGNLTDWVGLESFGQDGNDISVAGAQADWLETWAAHDANSMYFAYENDGPINTATWWPWQVFIDADNNPATGYQVGAGIGAEYVLEGSTLQQYTGNGSNWAWNYVGGSTRATSGNFAEIKLTKSSIGNPSTVRLMFKASNAPFTGSYAAQGVDYFPNNAVSSDEGYFSYSLQ